ncbi:unnamed protein product, partial [Gulo gulo]
WPGPRGRRGCRDGAGGHRAAPRRILDAFFSAPPPPGESAATRASLEKGGMRGGEPPPRPPPAAPAQAPSGRGRAPGGKDDVMLFGPGGPQLPRRPPQRSHPLPGRPQPPPPRGCDSF